MTAAASPGVLLSFQAAMRVNRRTAGLSQEALGARMGLSHQRISQLETGSFTPLLTTAADVAAKFGKSLGEFLEDGNKVLAQSD